MKIRQVSIVRGAREWCIEATPEGVARWMVRIWSPTAPIVGRVRIGYLTGTKRTWVAERFGGSVLTGVSCKGVLEDLGKWALEFSPLLRDVVAPNTEIALRWSPGDMSAPSSNAACVARTV